MRHASCRVTSHIIRNPMGPGYWGLGFIAFESGLERPVWAQSTDGGGLILEDTEEEAECTLQAAIICVLEEHYGEDAPWDE